MSLIQNRKLGIAAIKLILKGMYQKPFFFQFGLHQMISNPTHVPDTYSSCIGLIFTSQPNSVVVSGVHPSLHPNCHHQIIFKLKVHLPPPYYRQVCRFTSHGKREIFSQFIKRVTNSF